MNNITLHLSLLLSVWALTIKKPRTKIANYIKKYLTYSLYISLALALFGEYYRTNILPPLLKVDYGFYDAVPILKFIIQDVILVQPVIPLLLIIISAHTKDKRIIYASWLVLFFLIMMYLGTLEDN